MNQRKIAPALMGVLLVFTACGKGSDVSDGTGTEVAVAALGGSSNASEGTVAYQPSRGKINEMLAGGSPSSRADFFSSSNSGLFPRSNSGFFSRMKIGLSPISNAWAVPSCDWSNLVTACSANSETLHFDSCSAPIDPAIKISGSETLTWTGANCCTANPLSASSATPCSFTRRTVDASGASDPLVRSLGNHSVTLDTETPSGYDHVLGGGFQVACQGTASDPTCNGQRQITIVGAHYMGQSERAQWDHTVSTDTPIVEQGHGASRKVLSGVIRVQHNLMKMTSVTTVTSPLSHSSGCCYPTSGSVSTEFSGGKLDGKTETMTFGPQCARATLNDTEKKQTGLTLHHCL